MAKVVLANRWVAPDGKVHKNGATVEVSAAVARELKMRGKARDFVEPVKKEGAKNG